MRSFRCSCGSRVFFDSSECIQCGRLLGFDPFAFTVAALEPGGGPLIWQAAKPAGFQYRLCANRNKHCNWLLPVSDDDSICMSCRTTQIIPNLSFGKNSVLWARLEAAKRRLFYTLLSLNLPIAGNNLQFNFLEDRRTNPLVREISVYTGHKDGMITINVAEADDVARESIREAMGETYRTLLGHFRHESGHYYWSYLVNTDAALSECRQLFGDETLDYNRALEHYYEHGPDANWADNYITPYASSHPQEDWAETWAHFLHIVDTLETGRSAGWLADDADVASDAWLQRWNNAATWLNEMNRSLGLPDPYPFTLTPVTSRKLEFIRRQVGYYSSPR